MIGIVEPVLGMLLSSAAKRAVGQSWNASQTVGMLLEVFVDYIIVTFLVFMAKGFVTNKLKFCFLDYELSLTKEAWAFVFLIIVIVSALVWKQSKKMVFATVNLKSNPAWIPCMLWTLPNILLAYAVTYFLFNVVSV